MSEVYWLHLHKHTDVFTEGYIGVSIDSEKRFETHKWYATKDKPENDHLAKAIRKYGDKIVCSVLIEGEESGCLIIERGLRPYRRIGWNLAEGGGKPPTLYGEEHPANRPERKEQMRQRMLGNTQGIGNKGNTKKRSPEWRKHLSDILKEQWKDPEFRKKKLENRGKKK